MDRRKTSSQGLGKAVTDVEAAEARPRSIAAVWRTVLAGCMVGLLLGSQAMVDWVEARPSLPGWMGEAVGQWNAAMSATGLVELHSRTRRAFEAARGQSG